MAIIHNRISYVEATKGITKATLQGLQSAPHSIISCTCMSSTLQTRSRSTVESSCQVVLDSQISCLGRKDDEVILPPFELFLGKDWSSNVGQNCYCHKPTIEQKNTIGKEQRYYPTFEYE